MNPNQTVHLAIAFDENYVKLCYVFLTSVFENNKDVSFVIHALATGVSNEHKEGLQRFAQQHQGNIAFYAINENDLKGLIIGKNSHLTAATYYRFFFPLLVPAEVKKLLYMDVDIVVVGRLDDLYRTDISPYPIGAVVDGGIGAKPRPTLGINDGNNYFNAGVLLMDVEKWKSENVTERAFTFMQENADKIKHEDQDVLNGALVNQWYKLDKKYNVTLLDIPPQLKRTEYKSFLADKVVIHYTKGKHKPWMMLNKNPLRFLFHQYLDKSPWQEKKKYVDFNYKPIKLYRFFKIRAGEALLPYPKIYKIAKKVKLV